MSVRSKGAVHHAAGDRVRPLGEACGDPLLLPPGWLPTPCGGKVSVYVIRFCTVVNSFIGYNSHTPSPQAICLVEEEGNSENGTADIDVHDWRTCVRSDFHRNPHRPATTAESSSGSATTSGAGICLGGRLLVSCREPLQVARWILDAPRLSRRTVGSTSPRWRALLQWLLGRQCRAARTRSSLGPRP